MEKRRSRLLQRLLWFAVIMIFGGGVFGGVRGGLKDRPNWGSLHDESLYVWQHHETPPHTRMFGYLPTAFFLLWPFMAWLPKSIGLPLYVGANALLGAVSLYVVYRWWLPTSRCHGFFVIPALLVSVNIAHVIQANQVTLWVLAFCVIGAAMVGNGRSFSGGLLLGLAGLIKAMPFLLAGYLLLRRRWTALAGMLAAFVLFDLVPSILFFGAHGAVREHIEWRRRVGWYSNFRQIREPLLVGVHRHTSNFSYSGVLTRWLRGMPDAQTLVGLEGDPPADVVEATRKALKPGEVLLLIPTPPPGKAWAEYRESIGHVPQLCLARLSAESVTAIWAATLALALGVLSYATWRTGRSGTQEDWPVVMSIWLLMMFFVTPMMRHYYLALALPAIALVSDRMISNLAAVRQGSHRIVLPAVALSLWLFGTFCLGWNVARWYGLHLAVLGVLVSAVCFLWRHTPQEIACPPANEAP